MKREKTGEYRVTSTVSERVQAFVPYDLPPVPPLDLSGRLRDNLDRAHLDIGRLDGVSSFLPDIELFLYTYIRKEAVLSSQIEGTQSSLSDLLLFEMDALPGVPINDVQEVSNYVAAMEHGLSRLRSGFPLCNRLICEIHGILLSKGRGAEKKPGEFRTSQNWIGGTRPGNAQFVPAPPDQLAGCMSAFEKFLNNDPVTTPTLIKAALSHVQFETIHPFLDGNGRLGRLLITLILCHEKILREPLLYVSLYFKQHRQTYYELLQKVRMDGDWESWVSFFLDAVEKTAAQAVSNANRLVGIIREDRQRVQTLGRLSGSALRILDVLARSPVITVSQAGKETGIAPSSVSAALKAMMKLNLVKELTGRRRNRLFCYERYLNVMAEGTEPIPNPSKQDSDF